MPGRPLTYDHLKSRKKPVVKKVTIALDPEMAEDFNESRLDLQIAKRLLTDDPGDITLIEDKAKAQAKFEELKGQLEDDIAEFHFKAIGRRAYDDLVNKHQPTKSQYDLAKKEAEKKNERPEFPDWNEDTFPPALLFASCKNADMTEDQWVEIWNAEEWSPLELTALMTTAFEANASRSMVDLGNV